MSASQNKKKTLSLGLALIPVISMLLLLIIGYGIMGLRIEPLLLCSAAVAAGIAWWQGYCWEDIINSVVDKLAKAMPVIMILICVGGLIGTWMFSGTIPYMVYWGLKLISPEYILIAAFFLTSVVSVCTGTSWGSAGTVGVALMGVAAGLDVSLAAAAGAVVSGAYFGDKISPLSDSTNFAAIVADTTLFEHIQHLLWTTLPSFLLAAVVYLIAGHSNMLGEVATPQRVTDIIHSLESLYHFNIVLILPPVIVLWGAIRKMDCKKLGLDDEQLKWVMADVAGIAPSMGSGFGPAGSGFIRLNLGCPRTYLEMAIDGLKRISVKSIKGAPTGG